MDLGAPERYARVMSDPDFAPPTVAGEETRRAHQMIGSANYVAGLHLAFASQLISNKESKRSAFFAAPTAERCLTMMRLKTRGSVGYPRTAATQDAS